MPFGPLLRRLAVLSVSTMLLAACGSDSKDRPRTPTPTLPVGPTATATQVGAATATHTSVPVGTATHTQPAATATATQAVPATATATEAVATATATMDLTPISTATATPTGTSAAFTPTATPTGTTAATVTATPTTAPDGFRDVENASPAAYTARGSVNQVYIIDAEPGTTLELIGPDSFVVDSGTADSEGSLIFREVEIGDGYRVVAGFPGPLETSPALTVTAWDDPPDQSFYDNQRLVRGYGYLETRDGTLLAYNAVLPGPVDGGPYPTLIEYSGYDPANPDANQPSTLISSILGYAVVGVNMRGTGCSGGAFQFFEPLQSTDGYDVVEIVAAQPWAKDHQVGMVGLSYPGISQLFVAQLQPPSLAAIAPLAVIAETGRGTLFPGGILNNGFATDWAADRRHDAMPGGQAWSRRRIEAGDQTCIDNQKLKLQAPDILQMIDENEFYIPAVADPVTPALFVHNITVPVFLAGAWQDEQVGGYVGTMIDKFTGTEKKHFTLVNGGHTEPLMPAIFHRWMEFLDFYIRKEIPSTNPVAPTIVDVIGGMIFTSTGLTLPPDRFTGATSYEEALAEYEAEPQVRVLFESGAGSNPGAPVPAFEHNFTEWPVPGLVATAYYFGEDGSLLAEPPSGDGADSFLYDPSNSQRTTYTGNSDGIWAALPPWDWRPLPDGKALAYATEPLTEDTIMVGSGSVDMWIRATAPDVDIQATLSEIRPDGQEVYIQSGWLRASRRKLDEVNSTELRPLYSGFEADVSPLPSDEYVLARLELFPFAHAFRAGSRVRLGISAPGGDRPLWKFETPQVSEEVIVDIARSEAFPSRVVLPVVPGLEIPTELPPCPSYRGQPCRNYVELANTPVE